MQVRVHSAVHAAGRSIRLIYTGLPPTDASHSQEDVLYDRFATPGLAVVWIGHVGRAVSPTHARREVLILFEAFVLRVGAAASVAAIVTRLGAILLLTLPLTSHCC